MSYLILYFDSTKKIYRYCVFKDVENCYRWRDRLKRDGARTIYVYKLFGRS